MSREPPHVVIVGASGAIGNAIARRLAPTDTLLTLTYCTNASAVHSIPACHNVRWAQLDVSSPQAVADLFDSAPGKFGSVPASALVYCAGVREQSAFFSLEEDGWENSVAVNLTGAYRCIRHAIRPMLVSQSGRVVFIGSVFANCGFPGHVAYAAAKAGINGLCRSLAAELSSYGVTFNVVAPGIIESPFLRGTAAKSQDAALRLVPAQRFGTTDAVAAMAVTLLGDESSYVTGQVINVDGGYTSV